MEQLDSDDYFEVLGLARTATESDVRKAYRRLAVQWHPDKNRSHANAEEYFKRIAEAYAVLSDAEQRAHYERYGKSAVDGSGGGTSTQSDFGGFDDFHFGGHHHHHHSGFGGVSSQHARDIFEAFFAGMDPLEALFGNARNSHSRHRSTRQQHRQATEWDPFGDMGFGISFGGMDMGIGMRAGGGLSMLDSFFSGSTSGFGGAFGGGFGGGFSDGTFSSSTSSSTFTDRSGHVVTQQTTTTVDANGHAETVTQEFRNGHLVSSTASSRLADAGRMQLEGARAGHSSSSSAAPARRASSRRVRF